MKNANEFEIRTAIASYLKLSFKKLEKKPAQYAENSSPFPVEKAFKLFQSSL